MRRAARGTALMRVAVVCVLGGVRAQTFDFGTDFGGLQETFAPTTFFPSAAPTTAAPSGAPSASPPAAPTLDGAASSPDGGASSDGSATGAPTTGTGAPTSTRAPTSEDEDDDPKHDLPLWAKVAAGSLFAVCVCLPCWCYCWHVAYKGRRMPDLGGIGTSTWYDDHRGQTYCVILVATLINFLALSFTLLAADDDPEVVKSFNFAKIRASSGSILVGLLGYAYVEGSAENAKAEGYYKFAETKKEWDYDWRESCEDYGKATYGLLIPMAMLKLLAAFVVYRRAFATHDTPAYKLAGSVVEFACFLALLGTTTQFYATCWRYLPERDDDVIFPDADLDVPGDRTDRVQRVLPQAASITICVAGFASLLVSFLHHRTPCWNSELPAYDDVF